MKKVLALVTLLSVVALAPAQDFVINRLNNSRRHHDWLQIQQGDRKIECFLVWPEVSHKATVVLVIHENKGLTDWVRGVADQLAEHGYIAIAPDLLSGMAPGGGNTSDFKNEADATKAIGQLSQKPDQVTADLNAVADHMVKDPACNGKLAVAGFCWGGGQALRYATNRKDLKAAFVFYGSTELTKDSLARIACPVYGFYGGNDMRINASIPETEKLMKELGKNYQPLIYEGAGHGFLRLGEDPAKMDDNRKGREAAWERWKGILKNI